MSKPSIGVGGGEKKGYIFDISLNFLPTHFLAICTKASMPKVTPNLDFSLFRGAVQ